jgi:hypothetical protein
VAEASSAQASAGGTARTAPGGKAQRCSSRRGEADRSGSMWLSSAAVQDEASPLEHGMRDVRLGRSQTERKRARPWWCDSAQPRRKRGRGEEGRGVPVGCTTWREEAGAWLGMACGAAEGGPRRQ